MSFSIECACGRAMTVDASQASTDIDCQCGNTVRVPLLSELRRSAGQGAYEASTIDTINRMIRDGELPGNDLCAVSGFPTHDTLELYVQCESKWIKTTGGSSLFSYILMLLFLPIATIWLVVDDVERREMGRNRGLAVPLRVRSDQQADLKRFGQKKLRKLLRQVPIYDKLLTEFPGARISFNTPRLVGN